MRDAAAGPLCGAITAGGGGAALQCQRDRGPPAVPQVSSLRSGPYNHAAGRAQGAGQQEPSLGRRAGAPCGTQRSWRLGGVAAAFAGARSSETALPAAVGWGDALSRQLTGLPVSCMRSRLEHAVVNMLKPKVQPPAAAATFAPSAAAAARLSQHRLSPRLPLLPGCACARSTATGAPCCWTAGCGVACSWSGRATAGMMSGTRSGRPACLPTVPRARRCACIDRFVRRCSVLCLVWRHTGCCMPHLQSLRTRAALQCPLLLAGC